jgi:hypothetical protein
MHQAVEMQLQPNQTFSPLQVDLIALQSKRWTTNKQKISKYLIAIYDNCHQKIY